MDANAAIKRMMDATGTSGVSLSAAIGRDRNAVSTMFSRKSVPRVDTLAKMARFMGYRMVLERGGERIEIE
ncbi:XRE family transcriptional regulator [Coriobacteriales bacterium OH1046]|nr:XRE family transcriptional regulator [Coriobacteriales bacterium OH1046]